MPIQKKRFESIIHTAQKIFPFVLITFIVIVVWLPFDLNVTPTGEMWFQRNEVETFNGIQESFERQNDRIFWFWSVVLGDWITPDTYIGHQIVFILVYILRGVLTYLILYKLLPKNQKLALIIALASLFNPIEPSRWLQGLFWLGALHVHAHQALFLLPIYLFLLIREKPKWWKWIALLAIQNIVLWSYEGTLLLNMAVPALLFYLEKTWRLSKQALKLMFVWSISPVIGIVIRLLMYTNVSSDTHFIRKADRFIQIGDVFDGLVQVFNQLFVAWFDRIDWVLERSEDVFFVYGGIVFFFCLFFLLSKWSEADKELSISRGDMSFLFILGFSIIVLGFMPYALTEKLRYRYDRTLTLPWVGASIIFVTIFWQLSKIEERGFLRALLSSLLIAWTVIFGLWEHDRKIDHIMEQNTILAQIIKAIPQIEKGSAVALIYEYDCIPEEKGCRLPAYAFRNDRVLSGALQFIYNDDALVGYAHPYIMPTVSFHKENKVLQGLDKLIIVRYSPQRNEATIENEIPPGLIKSPELNTDEYAPNLLYDDDGKAPYRACLLFPGFFVDENSCVAAP